MSSAKEPANLIAKEIVQRVIGPHVVFELRGGITALDTLHASHIIDAMEAYHAAAMAEGSEPFDPAKHLSGWVAVPHYGPFHSWQRDDFGWELRVQDLRYQILYKGEQVYWASIPTASFFHALCGALNIKP